MKQWLHYIAIISILNSFTVYGLAHSSHHFLKYQEQYIKRTPADTICLSLKNSIAWQRSYGGSQSDIAWDIQPTNDGGYIVAGETQSNNGNVTGNHGAIDYWLIKLNAAGDLQWQKCFGGSSVDQAYSVDVTTDGGYVVAGRTKSNNGDVAGNHGNFDFWVIKVDGNGILQWQKCLGGSGLDQAYDIQQTTDGGYIVGGSASSDNGDLTANYGNGDYWVVKLNSGGQLQWQHSYGGSDHDFARTLEQTQDGGYIISGYGRSNDGISEGNYGEEDVWILKVDATGNIEWQQHYGGTGGEGSSSIMQTVSGGYISAGVTHSFDGDVTDNHGIHEYWVINMNSTGNIIWKKCLGGSAGDDGNSISQTADGGFIVAGDSKSTDGDVTGNHGFDDAWIVKLNADGIIEWQGSFGGSFNDGANCIKPTADGANVIAGYSNSVDGDVSGNHGNLDFWIFRLTPPPPTTYYEDHDGDGFGNKDITIEACILPAGYVTNKFDCNDNSAVIHPGTFESCNTIDDDCDGLTDEDVTYLHYFSDSDGDGYGTSSLGNFCSPPSNASLLEGDCNDANSSVNPAALEICNGLDDNCNSLIDDADPSITSQPTYFTDSDGDGYGSGNGFKTCIQPSNTVLNNSDCNDNNVYINPQAKERCNAGVDDDCDGLADDNDVNVVGKGTYYADSDSDSYGTGPGIHACLQPPMTAINNLDCNDSNTGIYPGSTEICNGMDDNCDGAADENAIPLTWYLDNDNDNYGNADISITSCDTPSCQMNCQYVLNNQDCDDSNALINIPLNYYADVDGDGYGNVFLGSFCLSPSQASLVNGDCNDGNSSVNPTATELCNGVDDNCNGSSDENSISATITAQGPVVFCDGLNVVLKANTSPGFQYQWYKNDAVITNATKWKYTASISGNYSVKISSNNCYGISPSLLVSSLLNPKAKITPLGPLNICSTGSVTLKGTTDPSYTYQWFKESAVISGATKSNYTAIDVGSYKVAITNGNNCTKTSAPVTVYISCKTEQLITDKPTLSVYPNPADRNLTIWLKGFDETIHMAVIQLIRVNGSVCYSEECGILDGKLTKEIILDDNISPGLYLICVNVNDEIYQQRLMIQK